jgi:hypothetical protein
MELVLSSVNYLKKMYNKKAFEILSSSINTAVFIDEKAKDFYSGTPIDTDIVEERLSVSLYDTFKNNGKSLTVHKFEKTDITDDKILNYLFNGKDLILLDWELDDLAGQEYSLKLLTRSIELPYINFCCIYSRSSNFSEIPFFLSAYFSGLSRADLDCIKAQYEYLTKEEIEKFWSNPDNNIEEFFSDNAISISEFPIERLRNISLKELLNHIYIALDNQRYVIPNDDELANYEVIPSSNDSFIVNNTFILVLKKDEDSDSDFTELMKRITEVVVKNKSSIFQLLGLEMQTLFNSNERFIDNAILKSSTEALFRFRNHLNDDKAFGAIIKKLLLEQSALKLRTAKLKLLDSDFLKNYGETLEEKEPKSEELLQLNTFYNAVSVKSLNNTDIPNLNFGDVFKDKDSNYYLCITALCDCYYPNKIEYNFFFVKGKEFDDIEIALALGDTAFLSFLPHNKVVYWGEIEHVKTVKVKKAENESEEAFKYRKLEKELESCKSFLYKPFYVKPKVYNVENNKFSDNKIRIWDITNKITAKNTNHDLNYLEVEYVVTLRNDYAQRIANHAFGHPLRVGIDFVKK